MRAVKRGFAGRRGEQFRHILALAAQLPPRLDADQHMRRASAIGDEHRFDQRESLGTADVLIEFAARDTFHHPLLAVQNQDIM